MTMSTGSAKRCRRDDHRIDTTSSELKDSNEVNTNMQDSSKIVKLFCPEVVDGTNEMEDLCLQLFDRWCGQRSIVPLTYLMHAWPIYMNDSRARDRLVGTLRELPQFHSTELSTGDHQAIERLEMIHAGVEKMTP
jgi:hypothetical protein